MQPNVMHIKEAAIEHLLTVISVSITNGKDRLGQERNQHASPSPLLSPQIPGCPCHHTSNAMPFVGGRGGLGRNKVFGRIRKELKHDTREEGTFSLGRKKENIGGCVQHAAHAHTQKRHTCLVSATDAQLPQPEQPETPKVALALRTPVALSLFLLFLARDKEIRGSHRIVDQRNWQPSLPRSFPVISSFVACFKLFLPYFPLKLFVHEGGGVVQMR